MMVMVNLCVIITFTLALQGSTGKLYISLTFICKVLMLIWVCTVGLVCQISLNLKKFWDLSTLWSGCVNFLVSAAIYVTNYLRYFYLCHWCHSQNFGFNWFMERGRFQINGTLVFFTIWIFCNLRMVLPKFACLGFTTKTYSFVMMSVPVATIQWAYCVSTLISSRTVI